MSEHSVRLDDVMPLIKEKLAAGQTVTFSPHGTSMLPMIRQGIDTVELAPLPDKLKKYDLPLYQRDNGQYVLHRIVKAKNDTFTCIGDNQFVFEHGVEMRQMIAVVVSFKHKGKVRSVNSFGYRFYCRFWHYTRPIRHFYRLCCAHFGRILKRG